LINNINRDLRNRILVAAKIHVIQHSGVQQAIFPSTTSIQIFLDQYKGSMQRANTFPLQIFPAE
jgi:hypothetical protein